MTELTPTDVLADLFDSDEFMYPKATATGWPKRAADIALQRLTDAGFEVRSAWPVGHGNPAFEETRAKVTAAREAQLAKLVSERDSLRDAMKSLVRTAQLLQQNAEGCAVNHHGLDFQEQGLPGWLRDTQKSIDAAYAALGGSHE